MTAPARSHGQKSIRASLKPRDLMGERPVRPTAWQARVVTLFPEAFPRCPGPQPDRNGP